MTYRKIPLLGDGITRRDFLDGLLLAAGSALLTSLSPLDPFSGLIGTANASDPEINLDPRALSGGNIPSAFMAAHWLRDGRLTFSRKAVTVASSHVDPTGGIFPIIQDAGSYDAIIVGGGLSGLSSAFHLFLAHPNVKILILEANPRVGGNASRDEVNNLPAVASAGTAYFDYPQNQFLVDFYKGIGVQCETARITGSKRSLYFDSTMPPTSRAVWNGTSKWVLDTFSRAGVAAMPFTEAVRDDFLKAQQHIRDWFDRVGGPTDPPELSDPKYDYLAHKSLKDYLRKDLGVHQAVADFYDTYASDCVAGTTTYVNAHCGISFLGSEYNQLCAFPGGNSYLTRRALKRLIPNSIKGTTQDDVIANPILYQQIDLPTNQVRYLINATGLRVDQDTTSAWVTYYLNGKFYRAKSKAVVLAGQMHTARKMLDHLIDPSRRSEMEAYQTVPSMVMNVVMRHSRHLVEIGPCYDYYWYSGGIWQDALRADYMAIKDDPVKLNDGTHRTVMTVYDGCFSNPATDGQRARAMLLQTPFKVYEDALRQDLNRAFGRYGFDFDRDVESLSLYRWGHALCVPYVGWTFGPPKTGPNGVERTEGNRQKGRKQIGRISFGAQDTEGAPAAENAIYAGSRTAREASRYL